MVRNELTPTKYSTLRIASTIGSTARGPRLSRARVSSVAVLPDGRVVSGSADMTLGVWDPDSGETLRILEGHKNGVSSVSVLSDGRVVSGSCDGLRVWDPESGGTLRTLEGHTDWVRCIAVLPGGWVVSGSDDHTLRVSDPERGESVAVLTLEAPVTAIRVRFDGLIAIGDSAGAVHFARLESAGEAHPHT